MLAIAALLLGGCGGGSGAAKPEPAGTPAATRTAAPEPTPEPAPAVETLPDARVDAGTVGEGAPVTASGEGTAAVAVVRGGEFGVVATFDCSACTRDVVLTDAGRMSPWGSGPAPFTGTYLIDNLVGTAPELTVVVRAEGPWTVTFQSWNDLTPVTGPQSGTGAAVLLIGDETPAVQVDYTPAGPDDRMSVRVISAVDVTETGGPDSLLLGDSVAFSERAEVRMPGVVTVATNGSWTVTPVP